LKVKSQLPIVQTIIVDKGPVEWQTYVISNVSISETLKELEKLEEYKRLERIGTCKIDSVDNIIIEVNPVYNEMRMVSNCSIQKMV